MRRMSRSLGLVTLVGITLIWGTTFVIVKDALDTISAPLLLALRFSLAGLLLCWAGIDRSAWKPAMILGLLSFIGFASQTLGLGLTSASNAAFITGFSVVLTPLLGALFWGKRLAPRAYLAAAVALAGLALISFRNGAGAVNGGDLWVIVCALSYACYIIYLGEVAGRVKARPLAFMQHLPMALLAWLWAGPEVGDLTAVPLATFLRILYLAAVATALVAVLQVYAQRVVSAHVTALVFALEPVFASLLAAWLLGERLGVAGWLGGGLMVLAMLVSELGSRGAPRPLPVIHRSESP